MPSNEKKLYAVILEIRKCFNNLKALSEMLLDDMEINPSMRAVMEFLNSEGKQTVPQIALARGVSRQHIQNIINMLLEKKIVKMLRNPEHKRSALYTLTPSGHSTFAQIIATEKEPLKQLATRMRSVDLQDTKTSLALLNQYLSEQLTRGT